MADGFVYVCNFFIILGWLFCIFLYLKFCIFLISKIILLGEISRSRISRSEVRIFSRLLRDMTQILYWPFWPLRTARPFLACRLLSTDTRSLQTNSEVLSMGSDSPLISPLPEWGLWGERVRKPFWFILTQIRDAQTPWTSKSKNSQLSPSMPADR